MPCNKISLDKSNKTIGLCLSADEGTFDFHYFLVVESKK